MAYKVRVSIRAQKEIENAIEFYALYSKEAPVNFILSLKKTYTNLSINPFYSIRYKNIRAIQLKDFPYSLYFIVTEYNKNVRVLSCFHNKRHPGNRPEI